MNIFDQFKVFFAKTYLNSNNDDNTRKAIPDESAITIRIVILIPSELIDNFDHNKNK